MTETHTGDPPGLGGLRLWDLPHSYLAGGPKGGFRANDQPGRKVPDIDSRGTPLAKTSDG